MGDATSLLKIDGQRDNRGRERERERRGEAKLLSNPKNLIPGERGRGNEKGRGATVTPSQKREEAYY